MPKQTRSNYFIKLLGIDWSITSHTERLVSAAGAFAGIFCIFLISQKTLSTTNAGLLVASMGASAVLLFAIPHGALSQPWNLIMGHLVSAFIGVTIAKLFFPILVAASLAVGLSVLAQYYLRCLHPPGGATALTAVIGGEQIHQLGYQFILTPVFFNILVLLFIAILFNLMFSWRRYPAAWSFHSEKEIEKESQVKDPRFPIRHEDLVFALTQLDSFLDVTEDDLLNIYRLATKRSISPLISPETLETGRYYTNDYLGNEWEVRQIVDWQQSEGNEGKDSNSDMLIYKSIDSHGVRNSGISTRLQFSHWASSEVTWKNEKWVNINDT